MEREKTRLKMDYEMIKSDYHELEGRHQRFVTDHLSRTLDSTGLGASLTAQDHRGIDFGIGITIFVMFLVHLPPPWSLFSSV